MELREYPFWNYINEDKSHYPHAKDNGYHDPTDSFLIGESGGFLLNINPKYRFVNTHLLTPAANEFERMEENTHYLMKIVFLILTFVSRKLFVEW